LFAGRSSQGKLFHPGHPANNDEPESWTKPADGGWEYFAPDNQIEICNSPTAGKPISCVIPDNTTVDYIVAASATSKLDTIASRKGEQPPFFMGVGHLKPHPFVATTQAAFDMYPLDSIPLPKYPTYIKNMESDPEPSFYSCGSMNARDPLLLNNITIEPYKPLPDNTTRTIRQAYFAGTSHTDEQIGKTLDKLEELGLMDNTVIIFHSDHGW
jgi:uncharacterized sulfatase